MNNLFADGEWVHTLCQFAMTIRTASSEIRLKLWMLPSCKQIDRSLDVISKNNLNANKSPPKDPWKNCPGTANLEGLSASITQSQDVSKMIIESRGVILKKDCSVHHMFLTQLQACLCSIILLEMGYIDKKKSFYPFSLSIDGVWCSRNSGLEWHAPIDKVLWLWFSVIDCLWTHNAALTLKTELGVKWFPPATKGFSVSKIVTVLDWDNIKTRLFISPKKIGG